MYEGYLNVSGVEIINAERTETYVKSVGESIGLRSVFGTDRIHLAADDDPYRSPLIDDAPWVNPLDLSSTDFLGLYPLDIEGLDESTMSAQVTEHLDDGASFGIQRDASRAVRVHGVLVGASHQGVEYGLSWLADAVRASECSMATSCGAGDLTYFTAEPDVCEGVFDDEDATPTTVSFGSLVTSDLISYRFPSDMINPLMPQRSSWTGSFAEGTRFQFGLMELRSGHVVQTSDIVAPIRRNYALNPRLSRGTAEWSATFGGTLSWNPEDGAVGGGHGQIVPSIDGFGRAPFGTSPFGFGSVQQYDDAKLAVSSIASGLPSGEATASIYVRTEGAAALLRVLLSDGTELGSATALPVADGWVRLNTTFTVPDGQSSVNVVVAAGQAFDFDGLLVEVGTDVLPFFDGDTSTGEYKGYWDAVAGDGTSSGIWLGSTEVTWPSSMARPFFRLLAGSVGNLQLSYYQRREITIHEQLLPFERTLHDVQCTQGPKVIQRYNTSSGYYIEVDLIFVAGDPHPYGNAVPVPTYPLAAAPYDDPDETADLDDAWLADPDSVAITAPPRAPVILDTSVQLFSSWQRYYVEVPADTVRLWGPSVPTIGINSKGVAIKQIRVRFHPNPFGYAVDAVDPLNFCSEFVISYLPPLTRLVVDGLTKSSIASKGGKATVTADHLLFGGADGAPITWPELTCGISYVMTIDVPTTAVKDLFDIDLVMRARG